jgi:zinc transport system ATP-binding protein
MNDILIEIDRLAAAYNGKIVLKDISLTICERDFLAITGPNGGGKTTLLKIILKLIKPAAGTITYLNKGQKVDSLRMGYLPQINRTDRRFPISVSDVIASGLISQKPFMRNFTKEQKCRIAEVAQKVGLQEIIASPIGELSGGQMQRLLLGRAIVARPQIVVLDEPASYIDQDFAPQLYETLKSINQESAVILVTHSPDDIAPIANKIININKTIT